MRIAWGRQLEGPRCLRPNACDDGPLQDAQTNATTTDRMRDINSMVSRSCLRQIIRHAGRLWIDGEEARGEGRSSGFADR